MFPLLLTCLHHLQFWALKVSFAPSSSLNILTFVLVISAVFLSTSLLYIFLHLIDPSAMFPRPPTSSMCWPFVPIGEFGVFGPFWGVLIDSAVFAVAFALIQSLCTCVCMPDAFKGSLSLSGSSVHISVLLPGELGAFDVFSGVLKLLTVLCAWVHAYGASV